MVNNIKFILAACAVLACFASGARVLADSASYDKIWNAPIVKNWALPVACKGTPTISMEKANQTTTWLGAVFASA